MSLLVSTYVRNGLSVCFHTRPEMNFRANNQSKLKFTQKFLGYFGTTDIFVKDLITNTITRVSTASDGTQGNGNSDYSAISTDGRYVVFESYASNLVNGDTNGTTDIFVKDLITNSITRFSTTTDGTQGN